MRRALRHVMGLMRESRKENGAVNESYQKAFFSLHEQDAPLDFARVPSAFQGTDTRVSVRGWATKGLGAPFIIPES